MYVTDTSQNKIFSHMTKYSKNIYNTTIYCISIYKKYSQEIFEKIYNEHVKGKPPINKQETEITKMKELIKQKFYDEFDKKYTNHSITKEKTANNQKIIYEVIKSILKYIPLINDNYDFIIELIMFNIKQNIDIIHDDSLLNTTINDQVDDILRAIYCRNYYMTQNQIKNNIPVTINDKTFINQVKSKDYLFPKKKYVDWKKIIDNYLGSTFSSVNNLIGRVTYRHLGENKDKLPSDIIINIMQKAYKGYISFYQLRDKGIKANQPKYLPKNGQYIIPFFEKYVLRKNNKLRLILGQYVSKNYIDIIKNKNMVCLNMNANTEFKKYVDIKYLKKGKGKKSKDFIINDMYINKQNKHIINSYYTNINIPPKLNDKKIIYIEIVPLYENHGYKICLTYEKLVTTTFIENISTINPSDSVSIDLGMGNLMVIYDPTGNQHIISGKYIIWLNKCINKEIDTLKSMCTPLNKNVIYKKIRDLLIRRSNLITQHFNLIASILLEKYKHKKLVIIGYNTNWKNKVNMDKSTNRTFYNIPYVKLLTIIMTKLRENGIGCIINEESYTSKCDSLALEEIGRHKKYLGNRIKRGLFSSSTNKLINADLNGAINIMRKCYMRFGVKIENITGVNLCNPVKLKFPVKLISRKPVGKKANNSA